MWDMLRLWATFVVLFASFWALPAFAWVEWHAQNEEVRVDMTQPNTTQVEHQIRYRVVMGPLKFIDVVGVRKDARVTAEASVLSEDGQVYTAHAEPLPEKPGEHLSVVRIAVDPISDSKKAQGLKRGVYTFSLRYEVDTASLLSREGGFVRLTFKGAEAAEGYDSAKVTFVVPSTGSERERSGLGTEIINVRPGASSDEIEIIRPHITKGETPVWSLRVEPSTFPTFKMADQAASAPKRVEREHRIPIVLAAALAALVGVALGMGLRLKKRATWRVVTAGSSLALALALEAMHVFYNTPVWVCLPLLAVAIAASAVRSPTAQLVAKPLALRAQDAFRAAGFLDGFGLRGFAMLSSIITVWMLAAPRLRVLGPNAPILFAMNLCVLIPLFFTGNEPRPSLALAQLFARLRAQAHLRVAPIGSQRKGGEVRLLIQPRGAMPGLLGLEARDAHGFEVFARVREGSPSERILRAQTEGRTVLPGRESDERVFSYVKTSAKGLETIIEGLAHTLSDRRSAGASSYAGVERRA